MALNKSLNIRDCALEIILKVMEQGEYSDTAIHNFLDSGVIKDKRDRAFFTRLSEGTIERTIELDYIINLFSKVKVNKMKPVIRNILRMGVYQIFYMERVPDSAVCNEAVKLAAAHKFNGLKGFVNGVLRNIAANKQNINYPPCDKNFVQYASVKYSMPEWIVKRYMDSYGKDAAEKIFSEYLLKDNMVTARCNISKAAADYTAWLLKAEGACVKSGNLNDISLRISDYDTLSSLSAFKEGYIQIQDESSMLPCIIADINKGDTIIDICAAPGGKTIHAADILNGSGKVISCDISKKKTGLIHENIKRTGFNNIEVFENDALVFREEWEEKADIVIADLPCSGLGVIGKKCDIKYKTKPGDIEVLAKLQRDILTIAGRYVKSGGRLVYSTCTITSEENEMNVEWIRKNLPFKVENIEERLPKQLSGITGHMGYIQVLPYMAHTDGFFVASFLKSV